MYKTVSRSFGASSGCYPRFQDWESNSPITILDEEGNVQRVLHSDEDIEDYKEDIRK